MTGITKSMKMISNCPCPATDEPDAPDDGRLCCVCMVQPRSVVLVPCGHLVLCRACAAHPNMHVCPVCRAPIRHRQVVFY